MCVKTADWTLIAIDGISSIAPWSVDQNGLNYRPLLVEGFAMGDYSTEFLLSEFSVGVGLLTSFDVLGAMAISTSVGSPIEFCAVLSFSCPTSF